MTKAELLVNLEFWTDCLENPTYNSLEVGFRHTPLSKDEIIQRCLASKRESEKYQ